MVSSFGPTFKFFICAGPVCQVKANSNKVTILKMENKSEYVNFILQIELSNLVKWHKELRKQTSFQADLFQF